MKATWNTKEKSRTAFSSPMSDLRYIHNLLRCWPWLLLTRPSLHDVPKASPLRLPSPLAKADAKLPQVEATVAASPVRIRPGGASADARTFSPREWRCALNTQPRSGVSCLWILHHLPPSLRPPPALPLSRRYAEPQGGMCVYLARGRLEVSLPWSDVLTGGENDGTQQKSHKWPKYSPSFTCTEVTVLA